MHRPWWLKGRFLGPLALVEVGVAVIIALRVDLPETMAPDYALGTELIWRGEIALVILLFLGLISLFVLRAFAGQLPKAVGVTGAEWEDLGTVAGATAEALDELRSDVDDQATLISNELGPRLVTLEREVDRLWHRV